MSVRHLDHVLIVCSWMEHVTWKSPGPMCGWVVRILHPDSCTSVSSWCKVPLLSIWSVAVPLCRPLLPCPQSMTWFSSMAWSVMADLWVTLLSLALEARVCVPAVSPLLSCVPWSSDQTSCLSLQHKSWCSFCKGHSRSIRTSLHPWPCPSDEPQSSIRTVSCGVAMRFQNSCKCLAQSFHIWHDNHTFVIASCVLYFLCFVLQRFLYDVLFDPIDGPGRVATLIERFSNVFFLLSVILFRHNAVAFLQ